MLRRDLVRGGGVMRHAYHRAPDGKTLIYNLMGGLAVQRGERMQRYSFRWRSPGEFEFCPAEPTLVATWSPISEGSERQVRLLDLRELGPKLAVRDFYAPPEGFRLISFRWSPLGDALLVLETSETEGWVWREVRVRDGQVLTHGSPRESPATLMAPYVLETKKLALIVGDQEGLWLLNGSDTPLPLSDLLIRRLVDRAHHYAGGKNYLALACRGKTAGGERARGVYRVDVDRLVKAAREGAPLRGLEPFERVHRTEDSKTLWFSPRGTYLSGATADEIYLRRTAKPRQEPTYLTFFDSQDVPRQVGGVYWNDAETKLAVIVERELWVYDWTAPKSARGDAQHGLDELEALTGKRPILRRLAEIKGGLLAEPQWFGDRIVVSQFEDAKEEFERLGKKSKLPRGGK